MYQIEKSCENKRGTENFSLYAVLNEDEMIECYILHLPSGTIINWREDFYNKTTCNKDGFSEDDLREFFQLLRPELIAKYIAKPRINE